MIGYMVRNFISWETNVIFEIYKDLRFHKECYTLIWGPVYKHGNWSVILRLEGIEKK